MALRHQWPDLFIIAAAAIVPIVLYGVGFTAGCFVTSLSARDIVEIVTFLATVLCWVILLGWAVARVWRRPAKESSGGRFRTLGLASVLFFCPWCLGGWITLMLTDQWIITPAQKARLLRGTNHRAVADACALVMSDFRKFEGKTWDDPSIPRAIREIRPRYIVIHEHDLRIEMHGGFDHYGLHFRQGASGNWDLWYYTESGPSIKLVADVPVERPEPPIAGQRPD
jgi:hypothetical protein